MGAWMVTFAVCSFVWYLCIVFLALNCEVRIKVEGKQHLLMLVSMCHCPT